MTKVLIDLTRIPISMSVNDSLTKSTYGISLDVPEELVELIISKGKKPRDVLSKAIARMGQDKSVDEIIAYAEREMQLSDTPDKKDRQKISTESSDWTYQKFDEYMNLLVKQSKRRASVGDLISMLIAYYQTGSRPTSEELREARNFGEGDKWYEELRIAKSRLTIATKHMGLPPLFLRAYGSSLKRRHPIEDKVYKYLARWCSENKSVLEEYEYLPIPRALM